MAHVENTHAVYAKLENRPGTLERFSKIVSERRINMEAISLETVGSTGFVRIVTPRSREVVDALRAAHVEAYESPVVTVQVPNRMGELHRVTSELAAAGINVEGVITTPDGKLAFRTSDNEHAAQILRKL